MRYFSDWFDARNKDHIVAYLYYQKNEKFPEGFIPDDVIVTKLSDCWFIMKFELARAYVEDFVKNNNL